MLKFVSTKTSCEAAKLPNERVKKSVYESRFRKNLSFKFSCTIFLSSADESEEG